MHRSPPLSRRMVVSAIAGLAAAPGLTQAIPQPGLISIATGVSPVLVARTLAALSAHASAIWTRDVIGIVDFAKPSIQPRFHLIDLIGGSVTTLLVAHGRGSDPDHTGLLQSFSNAKGSQATSEGAYLTGATYDGRHGTSRRLIGLDPTDSNVFDRDIVIHAARYVGPDVIATQGKLGRSDGCFAFAEADIALVLARLGEGRLIVAGRG